MTVYVVDVGQGAATLIEFSCGAILIDTGGEKTAEYNGSSELLEVLEGFFSHRQDLDNTLDAVFITHPHEDHALGAPLIWSGVTVRNIITNGLTAGNGSVQQKGLEDAAQAAGIPVRQVKVADIPAGGLTDSVIDPVDCDDVDPEISVLWGRATKAATNWGDSTLKNPNNHSVVVRVSYGEASLLITGDLETSGIKQLLKKHEGTTALDVDLYQPGHHGSKNGTNKKLLDAVTPDIAVISAGIPERKQARSAYSYGHPNEGIVKLLEDYVTGARDEKQVKTATGQRRFRKRAITKSIYATPWDGDVRLTMHATGEVEIKTER